MAAHWQAFSPDHEVPGRIFLELKNAVGSDEILPYFEKHGMKTIDPQAWYSEQALLDIYNDMAATNESGTMFDFVSIGMKEAEQAIIPASYSSLPLLQILQGVGDVLKLNNRGTDYGWIQAETVADHHVKMILHVPTPDDIWYGIFYGYVRRFLPKGARFTVYFDPDIPHKDTWGENTIIHITWK